MPTNVKDEFYRMTIFDLSNNEPIENIKSILKHYEELEMYLACAGIKKAIDEWENTNQ
jgi:short-subunit dehydrogenase involved in D-alanine esterification of teichoic acids